MDSQKPSTLKLAHLADIHIQDMRRAEYAEVFSALYASLRQEEPDLIVVAGDVLDKNTKASAHNIEDTAQFLMKLSDIAPVVMITGNHDTNCLTPGALDLLTPIVKFNEKLAPPRLTYWRNSGVYAAHGLLWVVIAPDGPKLSQLEIVLAAQTFGLEAAPWVCLFHEEVDGARFPNGQMMRASRLTPKDLEPFDIAIGGHIHLRQNITPRAAYCGSLVQQNIGEKHVGHGYLLWTIKPSTSAQFRPFRTEIPNTRGIDVQNLWGGFARIEISGGAEATEQPPPEKPILWELSHDASVDREQLAKVTAAYTSRYHMAPRAIRLKTQKGPKDATPAKSTGEPEDALLARAQEDARDLRAHEDVIRELLGENHPRLAEVIKMHKERYGALIVDRPGSARIRLLSLTFNDLYCFGANNVIDFTKLEGCVSGVVAPNYSGKSALIDTILFALYEEHPRARTKTEMIRAGAPSYRLTLRFELDGKEGVIEKGNFSRGKAPHSLYRFSYAGQDLTQNTTTATLAAISKIVGEFSHAVSCAVMMQDSGTELVTASVAGRKKLLSEILALGAFTRIEREATKEYTALNSEVKTLHGQYGGQSLEAIEDELDFHRGEMDDAKIGAASTEQTLRNESSRQNRLRATLSETKERLQECSARLSYGPQPTEQTMSSMEAADALQKILRVLGLENAEAAADELKQWNGYAADPSESGAPPTYSEAVAAITRFKRARVEAQQLIRELQGKQNRAEAAAVFAKEQAAAAAVAHDVAARRKRSTELTQPELSEKTELENANLTPNVVIAHRIADLKAMIAVTQDCIDKCPRSILDELRQLPPAIVAEHTKTQVSPEEATQSLESIRACHAAVLGAVHLRDRLRFSESCADCAATARLLSTDGSHAIAQEIEQAEHALAVAKRAYAAGLLIRYEAEQERLKSAQTVAAKIVRLRELRTKTAEHARAETEEAAAERIAADSIKRVEDLNTEYDEVSQQLLKVKADHLALEGETKRTVGGRVAALQTVQKIFQILGMALDAETNRKTRGAIQQEIRQKREEIDSQSQQLTESEKKVAGLNAVRDKFLRQINENAIHVARLDERLATEGRRSQAHAKALASKETLEAYRKILRADGGVADQLLSRARPNLEQAINASLRETGAQFTVSIDPDFEILHTTAQGALLPVSLASGYQKFALAFASRLALWRLAAVPLPDCCIVDEGFASCDEGNLEAMGQLVEGLASAPAAPRLVLVVSHLEALKARIARPLYIEVAPGGNRVRPGDWGGMEGEPVSAAPLAPTVAAAEAATTPQPRRAAVKPAVKLAPPKKRDEKPKRAVGRPRKAPAAD